MNEYNLILTQGLWHSLYVPPIVVLVGFLHYDFFKKHVCVFKIWEGHAVEDKERLVSGEMRKAEGITSGTTNGPF